MKLPNGYGSVVKLSGKRRKPYMVRKTLGWHFDKEKDRQVQDYLIIGYATTRAEGLQMLADYNNNPYDTKSAKMTFDEVYEEWSKRKYPTVSDSNVKGYTAAYKTCSNLYNKVFKDLKLVDLQTVIDNCGKNYPTMRKIKVLFNQLYDFALKNDICNKDYSTFVDIVQYKDRNPNKFDRNKFEKDEIERIWIQQDDKYYQIILMLLYNGVRISEFLDLKKENGKTVITFKNISEFPLNITGEELTERFVRGDRSRNTEGSGLGLSIAKSLVELQGGEMNIIIDGDLFKAEIIFN